MLNRDLWEALDAARIPGLPFTYVKGHSGDPDNDRCDAIAVAFSRGGRPQLAHGEYGGVVEAAPATAASSPEQPADLAPEPLQGLLTRLELADRLAAGGYGLSLTELAQLVELPLATLEQRSGTWRWRDWSVLPAGEGRWRLEREASGSEQREGGGDG